jgi:hypothetical protein
MKAARRTRVTCVCKQCGSDFLTQPNQLAVGRGKFCSKACWHKFESKQIIYECEVCGKEVSQKISVYSKNEHHLCSKKCIGIQQRGEDYGVYKFGSAYTTWRIAVRQRDENKCQRCGAKATADECLCVHHILPWKSFPEERFSVDNGVVLCATCHYEVHRIIGTHRTREELDPEECHSAVLAPINNPSSRLTG